MSVFQRSLSTWVTTLTIVLLAMVFAATQGGLVDERSSAEISRQWGSVQRLTWVTRHATHVEPWEEDLYGPFDLWDGEWWRVPVSNLHHADFWHLFFNCLFLAIYGRMLERHWGSWRFLCFLAGAGLVALLPEFLLGQYVVGFSGIGCAVFGALWGLRPFRAEIADELPMSSVAAMLSLLALLFLATEMGVLRVANLAHLCGLAYGRIAAYIVAAPHRFPRAMRSGFVLAHLSLIFPYTLVVQPPWNGRYFWYQTTLSKDERFSEESDEALLRRAVASDPELGAIWLTLGNEHWKQGRLIPAWHDLLQGLRHQPANGDLFQTVRRLWRRLAVTPDRDEAIAITNGVFGETSAKWLEEIRKLTTPVILIAPHEPVRPSSPPTSEVAERPTWSEPTDAWWWRASSTQRLLPLDPLSPHSAGEGELL